MKLLKHYDFTKMTELPTDFTIEVGEKWSNHELQHYVNKKENLYFDDGLVIQATYQNGVYESARINTKNNFFFQYGKIEVTAKVPKGKGTWPAIWMMPQHAKYGHWPKSGEIDIMEHVGRDLDNLFLCIHTELYNHRDGKQYYRELKVDGVSDSFYTYGLIWKDGSIAYTLNGEVIATYYRGEDGRDTSPRGWPFDEEFYLILNMAIGGKFGGEVDNSIFPQQFIIKEIKVYQ